MATAERRRTGEVESNASGDTQRIGDRVVANLLARVTHLRDADGNVVDTVRLSLQVCGCGYSFAGSGVG